MYDILATSLSTVSQKTPRFARSELTEEFLAAR